MTVLVDTNTLLYAHVPTARELPAVRAWLEERLDDPDSGMALCWPVVYAACRLPTHPRVLGDDAVNPEAACTVLASVVRQSRVCMVSDGPEHASVVAKLMETPDLARRTSWTCTLPP